MELLYMSMQSELLSHLQTGASVTTNQISNFFSLKNPSRAIHLLRSQGHCVYGNSTVMKSGATVIKYSIGAPSRSMVSAAAKSVGSALFNRS
jgi:hypothetical protein